MDKTRMGKIATLLVECDYEELSHVYKLMKSFRENLNRHYFKQISIGDTVMFESRGKEFYGKVIRVNQKTVTMINSRDEREYRVPISMIVNYHPKEE